MNYTIAEIKLSLKSVNQLVYQIGSWLITQYMFHITVQRHIWYYNQRERRTRRALTKHTSRKLNWQFTKLKIGYGWLARSIRYTNIAQVQPSSLRLGGNLHMLSVWPEDGQFLAFVNKKILVIFYTSPHAVFYDCGCNRYVTEVWWTITICLRSMENGYFLQINLHTDTHFKTIQIANIVLQR